MTLSATIYVWDRDLPDAESDIRRTAGLLIGDEWATRHLSPRKHGRFLILVSRGGRYLDPSDHSTESAVLEEIRSIIKSLQSSKLQGVETKVQPELRAQIGSLIEELQGA